MICRSCGNIYFDNRKKVCARCYTAGRKKERMYYTVKQWKKFTWDIQAKLSTQYELILTDHKTLKEKVLSILKRQTPEKRMARKAKLKRGFAKFNHGVDTFVSGINKFSMATNQMHVNSRAGDKNMDKITGGLEKASGQDRNFSVLGGGGSSKTNRKLKRKKYYYSYEKPTRSKRSKSSDPYGALTDDNRSDPRI